MRAVGKQYMCIATCLLLLELIKGYYTFAVTLFLKVPLLIGAELPFWLPRVGVPELG